MDHRHRRTSLPVSTSSPARQSALKRDDKTSSIFGRLVARLINRKSKSSRPGTIAVEGRPDVDDRRLSVTSSAPNRVLSTLKREVDGNHAADAKWCMNERLHRVSIECPTNGFLGLAVGDILPVRVKVVAYGSVAYRAGLRVGDAIVAINGGDVIEAPPYVVDELIQTATAAGDRINVTIRRSDLDRSGECDEQDVDDELASNSPCVGSAVEIYTPADGGNSGLHRDVTRQSGKFGRNVVV